MPKRNMSDLVRGAASDLTPIRRGRGLEGMIGDVSSAPSAEPALETPAAPAESTSTKVDMSTSKKVDMSPATSDSVLGSQNPPRSVKSFRLRDDLIVEIDTLAARERRKIYEIVEEALEHYLDTRRPIG